jgi:hypothetical protein
LRRHSLQGRHDDMLSGPNAEAAAHLLTRCLEAALCKAGRSLDKFDGSTIGV